MFRRWPLLLILCLGCGGSEGGRSLSETSGEGGGTASFALTSIEPSQVEAETSFILVGRGGPFLTGDRLAFNHVWYATEVQDQQLRCQVDAHPRGSYTVSAHRGSAKSKTFTLEVANAAPRLIDPGPQTLTEDEDWTLKLETFDFDGDDLRVLVTGLPPGATFDRSSHTLAFRPDFTQGGKTYTLNVQLNDGYATQASSIELTIADSIQPPEPTVVSEVNHSDHRRIRVDQVTDDYLDSEGYAGRKFEARIVVPTTDTETKRYPVRVYLHGLGGSPFTGGDGSAFRIYPHDDDNTYWWGYGETLPGKQPTSGRVHNYTQRRVLHLIEYVLKKYSWADPEQVYVIGPSMGGAGAAALGLLHGRHFAFVHATLGQTVARNHRPLRINQLSQWWGSPELNLLDAEGLGTWDRADMTHALRSRHEARNQFIYTKHGKDDATIHFGAVSMPSPLTERSFLDVVQEERIGHHCVWDEGGHGPSDPVLGNNWWDSDWNKLNDDRTFLRRNLAFVAFSKSSANNDPGNGEGNGKQKWSTNGGYAGNVGTPGDTGWNGDIAGVLNRYLRWDSSKIVDAMDRFEVPLWAETESLQTKVPLGYPPEGNEYGGPLPITADVTPRRVQNFLLMAGESVEWTYGDQAGTVSANEDGSITIAQLPLDNQATVLVLTRSKPMLTPRSRP